MFDVFSMHQQSSREENETPACAYSDFFRLWSLSSLLKHKQCIVLQLSGGHILEKGKQIPSPSIQVLFHSLETAAAMSN